MALILVVDDEPSILLFVTKILEARSHTVITAKDGLAAVSLATDRVPDVVVLDLNLPGIDGYEVCRRLKSTEATRSIPIIMMTADYATVEDAGRGTDVGADEYVVKPFLKEVFVHNVERLLAKQV